MYFTIFHSKLHKVPSIYISSIKYGSFDLNERILNHRQHPKVIKIDSLLWPITKLLTLFKNQLKVYTFSCHLCLLILSNLRDVRNQNFICSCGVGEGINLKDIFVQVQKELYKCISLLEFIFQPLNIPAFGCSYHSLCLWELKRVEK